VGRPPREDRPPEILEATCRAIARVGISGLYIRHVAEEAGVSRALVSYYFPTRDQLLAAALEYAESRAIDEIERRITSGPAPQRLEAMLLLEIDDSPVVRDNWVIWGELTEAAVFEQSFNALLETWILKWNESVATVIREGQAEGTVPAEISADDAAERLTSLVDGLGPRWLLGHTSADRAHELIRTAVAAEIRTP
jgi:AcrR family transcriptional regulator